jgi:hypothetical protein
MSQPEIEELSPQQAAASWHAFMTEMWPCVEVFMSHGLTAFEALLIMQLESLKNTMIELSSDSDDETPPPIPGDEWKQ